MLFFRPGAKINHVAAFAAKWPELTRTDPSDCLAAGWAFDDGVGHQ